MLADELGETNDRIRATALLREMRRRSIDRAAGARFAIWATGRDVLVMDRALITAVVADGPPLPPAAA